jgi:hypothetical protein
LVSGIPPEVQAETDVHWVNDLEGFYRLLSEIEERR